MASVLYYLFFLLFTLLCFIPFAVLYVLTVWWDKERVVLHWASRFWAVGIYRCCPLWHIRITGREKIDRRKPYVIVTNHQSMLDVPLMYVLPLNFKWVSKREVMRIPIFGWVLQMHGDIAIERGSSRSARHMMEQAQEYLSRGTSVTLFPEGTRTKDGRMSRFKEGAFLMARSAGVGILPVVHDGNFSVMDGWKLRMPHTFRVRVLDPLSPEEVAAGDLRELTAAVGERMRAEHREMCPDLYAGADNEEQQQVKA